MQYQLNISIDQAGVQQINSAGNFVTIVKNVTSNPLASGNLQVAWLAFSPFMNNQITWQENYYIYATTTVLQAGATIIFTSQTNAPAQLGPIYEFAQGVFTTGPQGSATTYNMENAYGSTLTFGLAQQATVNGTTVTSPLNAIPVLNNQQATFTPIETVSIYLSSFQNNGVVISQVAGNALTVQLSSQQPVANIGFNDATNTFILNSQTTSLVAFQDVALNRMPSRTGSQRQLR